MKKMVKAALAAALVCFSSSLFAAEPVSFLKSTTYNLFEDETVDNLAWGVEDADGLVLGGYNSGIDLDIGARIGNLWWSIYDVASIYSKITSTQTVNNDSVARDGINTDYVDVRRTTNKSIGNGENTVSNDLYLSFAADDWGVQSYWKFYNDADNYTLKSTTDDEKKASGYKYDYANKRSAFNGSNTFGANFKGIGLSEMNDADLYLQLNNFEVKWANESVKREYKNSYKQNGVAYSVAGDNDTYKYKRSYNVITPKFVGEMGFNLPELGALSTKFVLTEDFSCDIGFAKTVEDTTAITETNFSKATTKTTTTTKRNDGTDRFSFDNTITPALVFDFDVGENVSVKGSTSVGINTYTTPGDKRTVTTTVTEGTTYNKVTKLTEKTYSKTVDMGANQGYLLSDSFTTSLDFATALAVVYQVKPEKFNLNFGLAWNAGSLSWTTTTSKNVTTKETSYGTYTNEAGEKFVTADSVNYYRRDAATDDANNTSAEESKTTVYTADFTGDPEISIGSNWFLNDKVQLDMMYTAIFNPTALKVMGTGSLLEQSFAVQLSVKF